jgi:hypothetical protein
MPTFWREREHVRLIGKIAQKQIADHIINLPSVRFFINSSRAVLMRLVSSLETDRQIQNAFNDVANPSGR